MREEILSWWKQAKHDICVEDKSTYWKINRTIEKSISEVVKEGMMILKI